MAADRDLRFAGDHWTPGPHGVPILEGVTAWMLGTIVDVHPVHNNAIVVIQIEDGSLGDEDDALLYHERRYFKPGALEL